MGHISSPRVTVLLPVYNGSRFLSEAINSILKQTFTDFEFIIIDDGSTDDSLQIIKSFDDSRIRSVENSKNIGLPSALNIGLTLARGEYIARMDADDISLPNRLKKQVKFMDDHPEIGVCGTWVETIDANGRRTGRKWKHPTHSKNIQVMLIFNSTLVHSSVMIRKAKIMNFNLNYDPELIIAQDFDLWNRCARLFPLANLPEVLMKYRVTSSSHFRSKVFEFPEIINRIYKKTFDFLGIIAKDDDYKIHRAISLLEYPDDADFFVKAKKWLIKLHQANSVRKRYPETIFSEILAQKWFWLHLKADKIGWNVLKEFYRLPLGKSTSKRFRFKYGIKTLLGSWFKRK